MSAVTLTLTGLHRGLSDQTHRSNFVRPQRTSTRRQSRLRPPVLPPFTMISPYGGRTHLRPFYSCDNTKGGPQNFVWVPCVSRTRRSYGKPRQEDITDGNIPGLSKPCGSSPSDRTPRTIVFGNSC